MVKFVANYILSGNIRLLTGMHIGGIKETIEIGGTDSPVIYGLKKTSQGVEKVPIIPGSSLKGKIRSLLEMKYAQDLGDGVIQGGDKERKIMYPQEGLGSLIPVVFGLPAKLRGGFTRTRIIVRDSFPTEETITKLWMNRPEVLHGVEVKGENFINRITSRATPRFLERIPAGSIFEFEAVLTIYNEDANKLSQMLKLILEGMKLLEDSYLGGHGSRGYGKIRFENIRVLKRPKEFYETGEGESKVFEKESVDAILKEL